MSESPVSYEEARKVKDAHEAELMKKAHVVGVGVGLRQRGGAYTNEIAIIVMVDRKLPREGLSPQDIIPASIEGVPVDVQEVGQIRAGG